MQSLIEQILDETPYDELERTELNFLSKGTPASKYNQLKRAVKKGDLIRIRRGLYLLSERFQRNEVNLFHLAHRIYGPSYISFESALSYHGLIPEAVYTTTSATAQRSKLFKTPIGVFSFSTIPIRTFPVGINRVEKAKQNFLIASPTKALADYIYVHREKWTNLEMLMDDLRIDTNEFRPKKKELKAIEKAYKNTIISEFIEGCYKR